MNELDMHSPRDDPHVNWTPSNAADRPAEDLSRQPGGMDRRASDVLELLRSMTIVPVSAPVDFVGQMSRKLGWSPEKAKLAYEEYLRFILMAWLSPIMIVPSQDVDEVWHLHILHTRHYWDVMCRDILMKSLHHEPSLGTPADSRRHADHYRRTLDLYRHVFEQEAPHALWPRCRVPTIPKHPDLKYMPVRP